MTFKDWAQEYYESAGRLDGRIEDLKCRMRSAPADSLAEMGKLLELYRVMRYECLQTARDLGKRTGEC